MLKHDRSDTGTVKAWLATALAVGRKHGKTASGLAKHCETTPQAVSGWKTTGRITKTNLAKATAYFGHGPSFTLTGSTANEPGPAAWPFPGIDPARFASLDRDERIEIQGLVRERLERFEAAQAASRKRQRAA